MDYTVNRTIIPLSFLFVNISNNIRAVDRSINILRIARNNKNMDSFWLYKWAFLFMRIKPRDKSNRLHVLVSHVVFVVSITVSNVWMYKLFEGAYLYMSDNFANRIFSIVTRERIDQRLFFFLSFYGLRCSFILFYYFFWRKSGIQFYAGDNWKYNFENTGYTF